MPSFLRRRADPKNIVSIILGGGPGTQLFPLTKRAATPAVSESYLLSCSLNKVAFLKLNKKIKTFWSSMLYFVMTRCAFSGPSWWMLQAYRRPNEQLHQQWHQQNICADTVQLCFPKPSPRPHLFWKWHQLWGWLCGGMHHHHLHGRKLVFVVF